MARKPTIKDEDILEAAREVFLERGVQATTAEIASRAGISEGTIFRRFDSKEGLFLKCMDMAMPPWFRLLAEVDADEDLRETLTGLADAMVSFFEQLIPQMSVVMSAGIEQRLLQDPEAPPVKAIQALTRFFLAQQRAGRIRPVDPEITARMFMGSLFHFAFAQVAGLNEVLPMPRQTFIRGAVDTLLRGITPEDRGDEDNE